MAIWKTKWGWRAEFMMNGERIRAKGFFKLKSEARQWVKDEKKTHTEIQKRYSSKDKDLALWTLTQRYLADCKINYDKKTFDEKKYCLERFYNFVGDVGVLDVDPTIILEFINERAKTKSNNAANKDRKNLKAFYSWVQEMHGTMYDPTAPIKKKPHEKQPRRLVAIKDILKVLLVAQGHDRVRYSQ
jgi:site-specific recombinase XerD